MERAPPDDERVVKKWIDVWNTRDYEGIPTVLADSATISIPAAPGGSVTGHDEFEALLREQHAGYSDFTITIDDMLATDGVVMYEFTWRGTHDGEINGVPPTDREIELTGMAKTLLGDGKVQEERIYYDFYAVLEQSGLTFPSVLGQLPKLAWRKFQALR